jgi:hypothetical protein
MMESDRDRQQAEDRNPSPNRQPGVPKDLVDHGCFSQNVASVLCLEVALLRTFNRMSVQPHFVSEEASQ